MIGIEMYPRVKQNNITNHDGNMGVARVLVILINILVDVSVCIYYNTFGVLFVEMIFILITLLYARTIENVPIELLFALKIMMIGYAVIQCNGYSDIYGSLYYNGGSDDLNFERLASVMVDRNLYWPWEFSEIQNVSNYSGFIVIIAWVMRFVELFDEYHPFVFIVINISIWVLTSLVVLKYLNRHCGSKRQNAIAAMLLLAFPNAVYITTHVFRDTICTFLLVLGFSIIDRDYKSKWKLLFLLILFWALFYVRMEGVLILGCILCFSFINDQTSRTKRVIMIVSICALLLAIAYFSGVLEYSTEKYERYVGFKSSTDNIMINNIYIMPLFPFGWIARAMYGFISPLPTGVFEIANIFSNYFAFRDFFISIGMIGEILCLPFLFKRVARFDYVALSFLIVFLSIRLVTSGFRHIIMSYPFMCVLICEQLSSTSRKNARFVFLLSGVVLGALGVMFFVLF